MKRNPSITQEERERAKRDKEFWEKKDENGKTIIARLGPISDAIRNFVRRTKKK